MNSFEYEGCTFSSFCKTAHRVPFHQRAYVWESKQVEKFWKDINDVKDQRDEKFRHFIGSIVTHQPKKSEPMIIDGQQRITTFIIFYFSFYLYAMQIIKEMEEIKQESYVNDPEGWRKHKETIKNSSNDFWALLSEVFKFNPLDNESSGSYTLNITPSQKDRKEYNKLLNEIIEHMPIMSSKINTFSEPDHAGSSASLVGKTCKNVNELIKKHYKEDKKRRDNHFILGDLYRFMEVLRDKFSFVEIRIFDSDPTGIFNDLNTLGAPLSPLDIIRNSIFSDIDLHNSDYEEKINKSFLKFEDKFNNPINDYFGKDNPDLAKLQRNHLENYWMPLTQSLCNTPVNKKNMVDMLRYKLDDIVGGNNEVQDDEDQDDLELKQTEEKINILKKYVYIYNAITLDFYDEEAEKLPIEIKDELKHFFRMQCPSLVYNYIFQAIEYYGRLDDSDANSLTKKSIVNSFKLIQKRIMRDSFMKAPSQAPKDIYVPLFKNIEVHNMDFGLVRNFLFTGSYKYPSDEQIKDYFLNETLYGVSRLRYFLEEYEIYKANKTPTQRKNFLAQQYRKKEGPVYEIDHLMPQKWDKWKRSLPTDYDQRMYKNLINKIGNCFLLEKSRNIKKSNRDLEEAKEIISDNTEYGKFIRERDFWNDKTIRDNCLAYYEFFIKRWDDNGDFKKPDEENSGKAFIEKREKDIKASFENLFNEIEIDPIYHCFSSNAVDRNDANAGDLLDLVEQITEVSAQAASNEIRLILITSTLEIQRKRFNIYNVRRSDQAGRKEFLFSIDGLKEIFLPGDVAAFFIKNSELYCVNLTASSKNSLEKNLKDILKN